MATIAERVALLKLNQPDVPPEPKSTAHGVATQYGHTTTILRPRPPPPPAPNRRPVLHESRSNDKIESRNVTATSGVPNLPTSARPTEVTPALPARRPTGSLKGNTLPNLPARDAPKTPALPARRPSTALQRQDSRESIASVNSIQSGYSVASNKTSASSRTTSSGQLYTIRAPNFDASTLPPLPPKRTTESTSSVATKASPPQLPARSASTIATTTASTPNLPRRTEPPPPRKSALTQGFGGGNDRPPPPPANRPQMPSVPARTTSVPPTPTNGAPPPIPNGSRPDLSQLKLSKPKPAQSPQPLANTTAPPQVPASGQPGCLLCRDFSAPDAHAARFPRQSLPSTDISWLAESLTSPFPSATDKARAVFTWLHHNIAYDTQSFFSGNIQHATPSSTITSGLAVCAGYAGLFAALCIKAGLEAHVVSGHGKGYGFSPLKPGDPIPPFSMGHAWNAVLIDEGWKLVDPCWGAGVVSGQTYEKRFNAYEFTKENEQFGLKHFPEDHESFYRRDGACPSWESYMIGPLGRNVEPPGTCGGVCEEEGLDPTTLSPAARHISLSQLAATGAPTLRFSINKVCAHWDPERNGRGKNYCYWIVSRREGQPRDLYTPVDTDGYTWWYDLPVREIGPAGGHVKVMAATIINGKDGRGITPKEMRYLKQTGQLGGWQGMGLATWDVVP